MNKEDIIRMARESGLTQFTGNYDQSWALERFFHMAYAAGADAANQRHSEILRHLRDTLLLQERAISMESRHKA